MGEIAFEAYYSGGWQPLGSNRLVPCGSRTDIAVMVQAKQFQDGMHVGDGQPGNDVCPAPHANNVKFLTDSLMSVNGAGSEPIDDAHLAETGCTLRVRFTDSIARRLKSVRFYVSAAGQPTVPAASMDVAAFERGRGNTAWTHINNYDPALNPDNFTDVEQKGGDVAGSYLSLADKDTPALEQTWYLAISVAPEQLGEFADLSFGIYYEYY